MAWLKILALLLLARVQCSFADSDGLIEVSANGSLHLTSGENGTVFVNRFDLVATLIDQMARLEQLTEQLARQKDTIFKLRFHPTRGLLLSTFLASDSRFVALANNVLVLGTLGAVILYNTAAQPPMLLRTITDNNGYVSGAISPLGAICASIRGPLLLSVIE